MLYKKVEKAFQFFFVEYKIPKGKKIKNKIKNTLK